MDVLGVMNLRGAVIPIYDLSARFGLQQTEASERNVVIVVAVHGKPVGLLAESVSEIISINPEEIQDTPPVDSRYTMEYIQGIISHDDTMVRIINLDAVISAPEQGLS
ncbi:Positive regulator of CheA protein activity (CheW) [Tritonibacter mobilis]|nr:Positive regulator of CheA protein activity (CheW) [Tritonibacter mobilis]